MQRRICCGGLSPSATERATHVACTAAAKAERVYTHTYSEFISQAVVSMFARCGDDSVQGAGFWFWFCVLLVCSTHTLDTRERLYAVLSRTFHKYARAAAAAFWPRETLFRTNEPKHQHMLCISCIIVHPFALDSYHQKWISYTRASNGGRDAVLVVGVYACVSDKTIGNARRNAV